MKKEFNPFQKESILILDLSKIKEFEDNDFKFDKDCEKFSKRLENTMGKAEIVPFETFLLFSYCFQIFCFEKKLKRLITRVCKTGHTP